MADHCDIIIIGAGSAGLSAARSASEHGLTFTLLEASHRIGGRAYTEEIAPGQPFDLACHWMHSASLNPFVAIADRLGFTYRRDSGWSRDVHHRGSSLDNAQHEELEAYLDANEEAINEAALAGDSAVSDVIDLDSPGRPMVPTGFRWEPPATSIRPVRATLPPTTIPTRTGRLSRVMALWLPHGQPAPR